ncbi:hypothetical protein AKJ65_04510 [candidate division MSBL1 archaeon SCGC-AAA259E19]|uniref:GLUG domain-containing protein n=1 Tax=candidate division MSBL1 archaeon SCGC-AAA259E19 TaxID=1698264 RepID=A0A133UJY0_9EURY|nr:hypothetical protein AKJ65_04510 [candidate division MSBL1 archaeon SCGC-AAA259E19]
MEEPEWSENEGAYLISNLEELNWMRNDLDNDYVLVNDIDASETETWNGGKGWEGIGESYEVAFIGTFDGQGYEISSLYINENSWYVGFFDRARGEIKNVGLVNVTVKGNSSRVGALIGRAMSGVVTNCYATGKVAGEGKAGGLIGDWGGVVTDSYADVEVSGEYNIGGLIGSNSNKVVSCYATGDVTGEGNEPFKIGGLVGSNAYNYAEVSDSYATGDVDGYEKVGGLVGINSGIAAVIDNSYATGLVTGEEEVGGLVGYNAPNPEGVFDSFCDMETTGQENAIGTEDEGGTSTNVEALPTEEMKDISTFEDAGWDIEITSEGNPTSGYPFLSWQVNGGGHDNRRTSFRLRVRPLDRRRFRF